MRTTAAVGKVTLAACGVLAFAGLLFRSALYRHIPVESGEPYGYGDVLDGFLSLGVKGAGLFAGLWGVILVFTKSLGNQRLGYWLVAVAIACLSLYRPLHTILPRAFGP